MECHDVTTCNTIIFDKISVYKISFKLKHVAGCTLLSKQERKTKQTDIGIVENPNGNVKKPNVEYPQMRLGIQTPSAPVFRTKKK